MRAIRVDDVTPTHPVHEHIVLGALQGPSAPFCVLAVASDEAQEVRVALFPGAEETAEGETVLSVDARASLDGSIIACSGVDADGVARVSLRSSVADDGVPLVAAVAAVVQFRYGWDERPAIPVAIDGRSFAFTVQFVGGRSFLATARTDAVAIGIIP